MEPNTPDWEISKLYSKAFEIVKKNKLLWIFGLAAVGEGFNFRNTGNFDSKDFDKFFNHPDTPNAPETFNNILGAATSSPFFESLKALVSTIPVYFYLLLGLELLILVLITIVIGIIYSAWSKGLLLQSTFDASDDKKVSIENASAKVLPKLKSLIWLQVIPGLIFFLAAALVLGLLALGLAFLPDFLRVFLIIFMVIAVGAFIYWLIMLALTQIWAPRQVLFQDKKAKEAFFSGLRVTKKKFWASLLLGIVNNILVFLVTLVPIIGLVILFALGILGGVFGAKVIPELAFVLIVLAVPIILAAIIGFMLLSGALEAFKATVWTLAFKQIKGKYDS